MKFQSFLFLITLLFLIVSKSGASPIVFDDQRGVALTGYVVSPFRPSGDAYTFNNHREISELHAGGVFFGSVADPTSQAMNSHAKQRSFVGEFFEANGEAQAQFRNFNCCPIRVSEDAESGFKSGSQFIVSFKIDQNTDFRLKGNIGVIKGQWDADNPQTSALDVLLQLSSLQGSLNELTVQPLIKYHLTANDLVIPCPPVNPSCPYPFFDTSHYINFDNEITLRPGNYRLEAHAHALNFMAPSSRISFMDGAGIFDFRFKEVPEPSTLFLSSIALLLMLPRLRNFNHLK